MRSARREAYAFPLSLAQRRLWFVEQLSPGSASFNIFAAVELARPVDERVMERALNECARRHETLRTHIGSVAGEPVQIVLPERRVALPFVDLSRLEPEQRAAEIRRLTMEEAGRPFDLVRGPLFRARILRLHGRAQLLMLCLHHLVGDGWSLEVLFAELEELCHAFGAGRASALPELRLQYADFAAWQAESLRGPALQQKLAWWRDRLQGAPTLQLPTDRPRPPLQQFRGARQPVRLPRPLEHALRELSRREGCTLFMTLLAAFAALLSRWSGQDDVVIGSPVAGRDRAELERLIGLFVNMLVLRVDLSGEPTFRELIQRARTTVLEAFERQDVPFATLVEVLSPERDPSKNPVFQVTVQLLSRSGAHQGGPRAPSLDVSRGAAVFDLALDLFDAEDAVLGRLEYSTDLFDADTARRLVEQWLRLLEGAAADPDAVVSRLPLLSAVERERITVEWNRTEVAGDARCFHQLFEDQVDRAPDAPAVMYRGTALSYAALDGCASALARRLRQLGVGRGSRVGVVLPRSPEQVVALLGILKAGAAYVALDPESPRARLSAIAGDAGLALAIGGPDADGLVATTIAVDPVGHAPPADEQRRLAPTVGPADPAYVVYTSGSTGTPKGVVVSHAALANYAGWAAHAYFAGPGSLAPVHTSLTFDLTVTSLLVPLAAGGCVLPLPGGLAELDELLRTPQPIGLLKLTPSHLVALAALWREGELGAGALRDVVIGGETLTAAALQPWRARYPAARFLNEYGPTEATVGCAVHVVDAAAPPGAVPIGRPIANTRLYVLDAHLEPTPPGVAGELFIGGRGLADGYLGRADLTAHAFVADPFTAGERLYRSGDLARFRPDGTLETLGRRDRQLKIRGHRIEPAEVEQTLLGCPGVAQAAVVGRSAQGGATLVAYVAPRAGAAIDVDALDRWLRGSLPSVMVPSAIVVLPALPLTPHGKLDAGALPPPAAERRGAQGVAPRTETERELAAIFAEVLAGKQVGVHDDFFVELGGHSLLATQLLARMRSRFGVELPLRAVFDRPTVAGLAAAVTEWHARQAPAGAIEGLLAELSIMSDDDARAVTTAQGECQ